MKFRAQVEPPEPMRGLEVPPEVVEALGGGKRPAVTITINGHSWKSRLAIMRGRYLLGLSNANRQAAGVVTGDQVEVDVELDAEPRVVVEPADFAHALDADPVARTAYDRLSYNRKREHVLAIERAKKPETRIRRIEKAVAVLRDQEPAGILRPTPRLDHREVGPRRQAKSVMATWAEFADAEPGLAAFARERMEGLIVYQATLRLDGAPRVHPVSPWIAAGLMCVSFRDTSPKTREVARDARYALHTAQPWDDHAGEYGEFMARGRLEQISESHPAVMARPGQTPYGLVHYACSIEEAVATEYSDNEMPVYRRWKPSSDDAAG